MDAATAGTQLADAWPLYALRIKSKRLVLRLPTDDDLLGLIDLAKAGIHAPDVMPFAVAWTDVPSPAFERSFVQHHWEGRASWTAAAWTLHLMVELDGEPIGAQSTRAIDFPGQRTVDTGSWLGRAWQGRGLGAEMRSAVLAFAFDALGAVLAETEAFYDNAPSNGVSRSLGYRPAGEGSLSPRGEALPTQRWQMTADAWRSRPRPPIAVEGLEACRELFGV